MCNVIVSVYKLCRFIDTTARCSLSRRDVLTNIVNRTHRVHYLEHAAPLQGLGGVSLKVCRKTKSQ